MAPSPPASDIRRGGGRRPPSDPPPQGGLRGQSPRSHVATSGEGRIRGSSLWRDGARRLLRNRLAVAGGSGIGLLFLIAIFAHLLAPPPYTQTNFRPPHEAPPPDLPPRG